MDPSVIHFLALRLSDRCKSVGDFGNANAVKPEGLKIALRHFVWGGICISLCHRRDIRDHSVQIVTFGRLDVRRLDGVADPHAAVLDRKGAPALSGLA
jgi:hypothetical protein